jgi:hypothetical protein
VEFGTKELTSGWNNWPAPAFHQIKGIPVPAFHQMARVHQNYQFGHGLLPPTNPVIVTFITQIHVQTAKIYSKTEKISTVFSL